MTEVLGSYAIFCDDVRVETSGKGIFIGVYRDVMFFAGEPPWVLPQFRIDVVYRAAAASAMDHPIRFEIRAYAETGMTVLGAFEPDFSQIKDVPRPDPFRLPHEPSNLTMIAQATFALTLAPLVLEGETRISVHALSQGDDMIIDRIRALRAEKAQAYNESMLATAVRMTEPNS